MEDAISPQTCDFTLRYDQQSDCDPLEILAVTAEEIAMEMANMRAKGAIVKSGVQRIDQAAA